MHSYLVFDLTDCVDCSLSLLLSLSLHLFDLTDCVDCYFHFFTTFAGQDHQIVEHHGISLGTNFAGEEKSFWNEHVQGTDVLLTTC